MFHTCWNNYHVAFFKAQTLIANFPSQFAVQDQKDLVAFLMRLGFLPVD